MLELTLVFGVFIYIEMQSKVFLIICNIVQPVWWNRVLPKAQHFFICLDQSLHNLCIQFHKRLHELHLSDILLTNDFKPHVLCAPTFLQDTCFYIWFVSNGENKTICIVILQVCDI